MLVPDGIAVLAMDLQDEQEEKMVQMVRQASCLVTLDSGADVSVLPKSYAGVGRWSEGSQQLRLVDAQGKNIVHNGITKASVRSMDSNGKQIELVEEFVLGSVQNPILCAGKLLRKGWSISSTGDGLNLRHEEKQVSVPINNERNSLRFSAHIYVVDLAESQKAVEKESALRGTPSKHIQDLEMEPGWHRLPNGIVAYSEPSATSLPKKPLPKRRQQNLKAGWIDWSEDDREDEEELELQMDARDIEKMVVAERPNEVELDEVVYTDKMTVKELRHV